MRVLDSLVPQVHEGRGTADVVGDVRDPDIVRRALEGVDAVVHLAARVGVGQSMYEMAEYTSANSVGTAVLLEALAEKPVRKLVVASSMSIYGEGLYRGGEPGSARASNSSAASGTSRAPSRCRRRRRSGRRSRPSTR